MMRRSARGSAAARSFGIAIATLVVLALLGTGAILALPGVRHSLGPEFTAPRADLASSGDSDDGDQAGPTAAFMATHAWLTPTGEKDKQEDRPKPRKEEPPVDPDEPPVPPEVPPAEPPAPPATPGTVTGVVCVSGDMADIIAFSPPADGGEVTGYVLLRAETAETAATAVASCGTDVHSFIFAVAEPGPAFYRVMATGPGGEGPASGAAGNDRVSMTAEVPRGGHTLRSSNGEVVLVLSPGSYTETTTVTVTEADGSALGHYMPLSGLYDITPSGPLGAPATISVAYTMTVAQPQIASAMLAAARVATYDEATKTWVPVPGSTVSGGFITATLTHFSYYTGVAPNPHGTSGEALAYCSAGGEAGQPLCHDLAAESNAAIRLDARDPQVCYYCHGNLAGQPSAVGIPESPNIEAQFGMPSVHPVGLTEGFWCTSCHDPHKNPNVYPKILRSYDAMTGAAVTGGNAFCWTCHGVVRNRRVNYNIRLAHPEAPLYDYWANTGGDKKTGYVSKPHATIGTSGDITCTACHASHGSSLGSLIVPEIETTEGTVTVARESQVCLACHRANAAAYPGSTAAAAGKHVTVTASTRALTKFPGSVGQGQGCTGCHEPHGSGTGPTYTRLAGENLCLTCHDAAGLTYGADYSYQGPMAFSASGHSGLTGGFDYLSLNSTSAEFAAWQSATMPTPSAPGTPVDASGLEAVASVDGVFLTTSVQTTTGSSDYQMYRFRMPADKADVASVALTWRGYGEAAPGYPVTLWVWDPGTSTWDQVDSRVIASPQQIVVNIAPADHIDASGYMYVLAQARYVYDAAIISGPTYTTLPWNPAVVNVQWTTAGLASSLVDYGPTTAYGTVAGNADERVTNHVVDVTVPVGATHLRVRSITSFGESSTSSDYLYAQPRPTIVSTSPPSQTWYDVPLATTLAWNSMTAPGGPYTYRLQVTRGGSQILLTDWMTDLSYVFYTSTPGTYSWCVEARDASQISYGWSNVASFLIYDGWYVDSCPNLFTWDGDAFRFVTDVMGLGPLGVQKRSGAYVKPEPVEDTVIPPEMLRAREGMLDIRLSNDRTEIEYIDEVDLVAVDHPAGTRLLTDDLHWSALDVPRPPTSYHTIADPRPVGATYERVPVFGTAAVQASDVSAELAGEGDGQIVYGGLYDDNIWTFDLGDLGSPSAIKLVLSGWTAYPSDAEKAAWLAAGKQRPASRLEVEDAAGNWIDVGPGAFPPGYRKTVVYDLAGVFPEDVTRYRVRLRTYQRMNVDYAAVDTTQDAAVTTEPLTPVAAVLAFKGISRYEAAPYPSYVYGDVTGESAPVQSGAFTRYGDVSELLLDADDRFVVMDTGDDLAISFDAPAAPSDGMTRTYVIHTDGYHDTISGTVDPLPFHAMSNYPYASTEHYPDDAEHVAYLAEWNTRIRGNESGGMISDALAATAEGAVAALKTTLPIVTASAEVGEDAVVPHRSLNTDVATLEVTLQSSSGAGGACGVCHAMHGATEWGEPLTGGRIASDGQTCTTNGSGGCHDSAANSSSGIDIRGQFTANSSPTAHHDVLMADQSASGGRTSCADCHNPHQNNPTHKVSDPDNITMPVTTGLASSISETGDVYLLAGARHDGTPPVISNVVLSGTGLQYASPFVTWTTDESASSYIEWGTTTAYENAPFGNDTPAVSHSVQMTGLVSGTTYYYRVRSTDALNNTAVSDGFTFTPIAPPPTPTMSDETTFTGPGYGPISVTVTCSPVSSSDGHGVEYQFQFDGAAYLVSGWQASTAFATPSWFVNGVHTVIVRARDAVDTDAVSAWSAADSFVVQNAPAPADSCPNLFTWDGGGFRFVSDVMGLGPLGVQKRSGAYVKPEPVEDTVIPTGMLQAREGSLDIHLTNDRTEVEYVDEVSLIAVDHPADTRLLTNDLHWSALGVPRVPTAYYTIADPQPVRATYERMPVFGRDSVGPTDVTAALAAEGDGQVTYGGLYDDNIWTFDLGEFDSPDKVKFILSGWVAYPTDEEKTAWLATGKTRPESSLEVQDANGAWVSVGPAPFPPGYPKTVVYDLTDLFPDGLTRYRVRLRTYQRMNVDYVGVDTSADAAVSTQVMAPSAADLSYLGTSRYAAAPYPSYVYGDLTGERFAPQTGAFTRFGDVTELLLDPDDRFVIMDIGDDLAASFDAPAEPAVGMTRTYVIHTDGYHNTTSGTVDPLPFHAMSNYPYPATEHYPDDAAHAAYLAEWNTRIKGLEPSAPAAPTPWLSYHVATPLTEQGMFSVDTDYAALRTLVGVTVTYVQASAGWQSQSVESNKPTPSAPGEAVLPGVLDLADSDDDVRWQTDEATSDGAWNWQLMKFDLAAQALGDAKELAILWNGHGEPTAGYPTALFVWNPGSSTWNEITRFVSGADRGASVERRAVDSTFCLKCHDGAPPSGVVFPATMKNVGASWGAGTGDFHGGGSGTGLGTALAAPYIRGNSAIACGTCHEAHGTANVYHFPTWINGTSGISVPTANAGAAQVCGSCHVSSGGGGTLVNQYHAACVSCHVGEGHGWATFEGSDCLSCHKHGTTWNHYANIDQDYYNTWCHCGVPGPYKTF